MNEQEKEQKVESSTKTAHVASKTAVTAAGTVVGGKLGGTVANKAYNIASKTKLGKGIERSIGKSMAKTPLGNINKKLDDIGVLDRANKLTNRGGKIKNDVPEALKEARRYRSVWQNRNQNTKDDSQNENQDNEDKNDDYEDDSQNEKKDKKVKGTVTVGLAPLLIPIFIIAVPIILIILIVTAVFDPISSVLSVFSLDSWHKSEQEYVYEENDAENRKANEEYNNYILGSADGSVKGIVQKYQEKYGVTIDWVMLDTVIQYRNILLDNSTYTNEDNEDITDEELEKRLDELGDLDTDGSSSGSVDVGTNYNIPKLVINYVASLMIQKEGGSYVSDLTVGGKFYNTLIDSWFLKVYYRKALKDDEYETRKELVDDIFEQYEFAKEALHPDSNYGVISDSMQVYLQTCEFPYKTMTNERGKQVFDNSRNINKGTSYPQYFSLTDYLKGAVEGELGRNALTEENKEGVKAFVIATLSYALGSFYVDFYPGVQSFNFPTGNCRLVSCDVKNGCSYVYNSSHEGTSLGTAFSGTNRGGGIHKPWNEEQQAYMDEVLGEIFGIVMVKPGVTVETFRGGEDLTGGNYYNNLGGCGSSTNCMGQLEALADSRNGMTYEQILNKYYHNFDLINIKEGLYYESGGSFNGQIQLNEQFHFHQGDYTNRFCAGGQINNSGCSISSAAIAISLLTGQRHDPVEINDIAASYGNGSCGAYGSHLNDLIIRLGQEFGLTTSQIYANDTANVNQMLQYLSEGNTVVIARMAPNSGRYSTGSGHYITLVGVKSEGGSQKVLVWDPGSRSSSRDNYWADLNDDILKYIRKDVYAFMIFRNLQ